MSVTSRRALLRTAMLLPLAMLASTTHAQGATPKRHRLVIQVTDNDPARWNMILNNTRNAQEDVGGADKIDIEIVAYGPGIYMLKGDSPVGGRVTEAIKNGVKIVGCENTMKGMKLSKDEMLPVIGYVPAGVTELMKRQEEGWAYIRP
jgi:hypothetical protein